MINGYHIKDILQKACNELSYNFYFGNRTEIDNLLILKGKDITQREVKYPFVWLVTNYSEKINNTDDFYSTIDFSLVFVNVTKRVSSSENRYNDNIDTVLHPIASSLFGLLNNSTYAEFIHKKAGEILSYQSFERYLYGNENKNTNVFSDNPTDAIEVKASLRLNINYQNCNQ